jgi:predicted ribosome quality control (RQC) complex YloA/Tae2 family protein
MEFRAFVLSSGKRILLGKNEENNEDLVKQVEEDEYVFHTKKPGSPFANIKFEKSKVLKGDLTEGGVICAKFSQDWRDSKNDIIVHVFLGKDVFKKKGMKTGTFGVNHFKEMIVKKKDIVKFEEDLKFQDEANKKISDR